MKNNLKNKKAFTLIELLVVVAIVSLLASVILASLSSARAKAKDAAIRQSMNEFRKLLEQEYNDVGSYTTLQQNFWGSSTNCANNFSGDYASQATAICNNIVKSSVDADNPYGDGYEFYTGLASWDFSKYSIMAWLPGKNAFLCMGSSGQISDIETGLLWDSPGCHNNP